MIQVIGQKPKFVRPELLTELPLPLPLHGVNPRSIFGDVWWDKQRAMAYSENNKCCWACGIHSDKTPEKFLDAHESYERKYDEFKIIFTEVVALCRLCHNFIHIGRMRMLLEKRAITKKIFDGICKHGKLILEGNGLSRHEKEYSVVEWNKWRMIIDGKEYPPKFNNIVELKKYYAD